MLQLLANASAAAHINKYFNTQRADGDSGNFPTYRPRGEIRPLAVKPGGRVLSGKWSGTEVKLDGDALIFTKPASSRAEKDTKDASAMPHDHGMDGMDGMGFQGLVH
jgi:hypothetical protein